MIEALKALDKFEKTGNRKGFKDWQEKYGEKMEKERVADDRQEMGKDREPAQA